MKIENRISMPFGIQFFIVGPTYIIRPMGHTEFSPGVIFSLPNELSRHSFRVFRFSGSSYTNPSQGWTCASQACLLSSYMRELRVSA